MKTTIKVLLAITGSLVFACACQDNQKGQLQMNQQPASSLPKYLCKKVDTKIQLTGKLDDPAWSKAEPAQLTDAVSGEPGRFSTEVRVLYDDTYLYVGFQCEDTYVWGTITEREGSIWEEECVEVFLDPASSEHQYYEINVSPKNTVFDAVILNPRNAEKPDEPFTGLPEWNSQGLVTAVHIAGEADSPGKATGWSAEFAIPLQDLVGAPNIPPHFGDTWRANFYRIDSPEKDIHDHYAWSTPGKVAFHLAWRFGYLRFE